MSNRIVSPDGQWEWDGSGWQPFNRGVPQAPSSAPDAETIHSTSTASGEEADVRIAKWRTGLAIAALGLAGALLLVGLVAFMQYREALVDYFADNGEFPTEPWYWSKGTNTAMLLSSLVGLAVALVAALAGRTKALFVIAAASAALAAGWWISHAIYILFVPEP